MVKEISPTSLCLFSYKGGTGKTIIATNLAVEFSMKGFSTIIVDLNFNCPNLHTIFKTKTSLVLNDYYNQIISKLKTRNRIASNFKKFVMNTKYANLDLIISNPELSLEEDLIFPTFDIEKDFFLFMIHFINELKSTYDIIIFDLPSNLNYCSLSTIIQSDILVGCLTLDYANLFGMSSLIKLLRNNISEKGFDIFISLINPKKDQKRSFMIEEITSKIMKLGARSCNMLEYSEDIMFRNQIENNYIFAPHEIQHKIILNFTNELIGRIVS